METKFTRPLLRYPGSKFQLRSWIYEYFPPHNVYVESFCGAASMLFYKKPSTTEIINDIDQDIFNLFRVLKNPTQTARLVELLRLTSYSRLEYEQAWKPARSSAENAARFITRLALGQMGKLTKSGFDTRINNDGYCGRVNYFNDLPQCIWNFSERLKQVIHECIDGIELINQISRVDALHFVDPEYLNVKKGYQHSFTIEDHFRLSEALHKNKGMILLCGYKSPEYKEWYEANGWTRVTNKAFADGGHKRVECLWLNPAAQKQQKSPTLFDAIPH